MKYQGWMGKTAVGKTKLILGAFHQRVWSTSFVSNTYQIASLLFFYSPAFLFFIIFWSSCVSNVLFVIILPCHINKKYVFSAMVLKNHPAHVCPPSGHPAHGSCSHISPCLRKAASGPGSSSPQPYLAWPWVPTVWAYPQDHVLVQPWPGLVPVPKEVPVSGAALLLACAVGWGLATCSCPDGPCGKPLLLPVPWHTGRALLFLLPDIHFSLVKDCEVIPCKNK